MRRKADRGHYDRSTIDAILDGGIVCHLGFAVEDRTWVVPTAYARIDDAVYVHGAVGNHALRAIADGAEACLTVTHVDGLVLARSAFHHSINFRSVLVFGHGERIDDPEEKARVLTAIVEHIVPGRASDSRPPTPEELRQTLVVRIPLDEASAKIRTGGPIDDEEDMSSGHWAGVVPLSVVAGTPEPDGDFTTPDYLAEFVGEAGR